MPRALDTKQLQYNNDPTRSGTEFHLGSFQQIDKLIAQILEGALDSFKLLIIPAIEELTGLDLTAVMAVLDELELDFSSPEAFLTSLVHAITILPELITTLISTLITELVSGDSSSEQLQSLLTGLISLLVSLPTMLLDLANALIASGAGLLGIDSPLNALNLFNLVPGGSIPSLDASKITSGILNLLQIPGLPTSQITSGTFLDTLIPNLAAGKITTGTFGAGLIPSLDASKVTTGTFADTFMPTIGTLRNALGQAINGGSGTYTDATVKTAINSKTAAWITGFYNALTGQTETLVPEPTASVQAAELAATLAANSRMLAELQATSDGTSNSGLSGGDDFERVATTNLGGTSFWTETYAGLASATGTSNDGYMAIVNGHEAKWVEAPVPTSPFAVDREGLFRRTASADAVTETLYQKVTATIGTYVGMTPTALAATFNYTRLYCRMNAAQTQYVFIELFGAPAAGGFKARFGYKNGGSEVYITTASDPDGPVDCTQSAGATFHLIAGTAGGVRVFQLYKGGFLVLTWNDTGNLSAAVDGTNNGWGFGSKASTRNEPIQTKPSSLTGITIADNVPPTLVGSGAHITRTSTTAVGLPTGVNVLANNFFANTSLVTSDITVDLTTGRFTVSKAGWYQMELGLLISGSAIFEDWNPILFVNGTGVKSGGPRMNEQTYGQSSWSWYLAVGDYVQGGTYRVSGSNAVLTGESTGMWTYFSIALMNRSYA